MMRPTSARALLRPLQQHASLRAARPLHNSAKHQMVLKSYTNATAGKQISPVALVAFRQANTALVRSYATAVPGTTQSSGKEAHFAEKPLVPHPNEVTLGSSMHPVLGELGPQAKEEEIDMMAGIKHDLKIIKETFALDTVPKEALNIGLAGVVPYLATSLGTVYCAVEIHNGGILVSERTAELMLHVLEPLQVGYGAVIISFLGAIHWGLEWAGYGGKHGYPRYAIGIVAPAVAWPTILMPVEYALITQFLAFNLLYTVDSSATTRGWTPPWYSSYRFILTFIVGASIVVSLIGRGQIADRIGTSSNTAEHVRELTATEKKPKKGKKSKKSEDDE